MSAASPQTSVHQRRAADPVASVWVSANAGSGKTHILSQRVARLMLRGVDPASILCLTYTRAAAANMTERVFQMLGAWAVMQETELHSALQDLEGRPPTALEMKRARELFARALDTPGGLRIRTIHAFAESVLRAFHFEAGVPAGFGMLGEEDGQKLWEQALQKLMLGEGNFSVPSVAQALQHLLDVYSPDTLQKNFKTLIAQHDVMQALAHERGLSDMRARLRTVLGLKADDSLSLLHEQVLDFLPDEALLKKAADILLQSSHNDQKIAARIVRFLDPHTLDKPKAALELVIKDNGQPYKLESLFTKLIRGRFPDIFSELGQHFERMVDLYPRILSAQIYENTVAMLACARELQISIEQEKQRLHVLDFDDLLLRLDALLQNHDNEWIRYKLDQGLDHILIDEAQDTSPLQWSIIQRLSEEFYAGEGGKGKKSRTLFAVGDEKQSIYGFQGADPQSFARIGEHLTNLHAPQSFQRVSLHVSYRSTPEVLNAVDLVFSHEAHHRGLSSRLEPTVHTSGRAFSSGRVELWAPLQSSAADKVDAWQMPFARSDGASAHVLLAEAIGECLSSWFARGEINPATGKPLEPKDILILVRKRGAFFKAMLKILKARNIAVAGADRLDIFEHLAVRDLLALAQALLVPEDDLSLACALKSPIFGCDDEDLLALTDTELHPQPCSLYRALERSTEQRHTEIFSGLQSLRERALSLSPYHFFQSLLNEGDLSNNHLIKIRARLGPEVDDAINEFLNFCLDFESQTGGTLAHFLSQTTERKKVIKRDFDHGVSQVRVMTVHGAKGLEAPVVFVTDPEQTQAKSSPLKFLSYEGAVLPFMASKKELIPECLSNLLEAIKLNAMAEHRRLFYVALTRAADRLIVCGACSKKELSEESWLHMALESWEKTEGAQRIEGGFGAVPYHIILPHKPSAASELPPEPVQTSNHIPRWLKAPLPDNLAAAPVHRPSRQSSPAGLDMQTDHRDFGVLVHVLSAAAPLDEGALKKLAQAYAPHLSPERQEAAIAAVLWMMRQPDLAPLFYHANARAEVSLSAHIDGVLMMARVDRALFTPESIQLLEIKTGNEANLVHYKGQIGDYLKITKGIAAGKPAKLYLTFPLIEKIEIFL